MVSNEDLQPAYLTTTTPKDRTKKHPMFDRKLPDFWARLSILEVDGRLLGSETEKDDYITDVNQLLRMIDDGTDIERSAIGLTTREMLRMTGGELMLSPIEIAAGMPKTYDELRWKMIYKNTFKLIINLKRMRPSRIHLAIPHITTLLTNPYHQPADPLLLLLRGVALSKDLSPDQDRESEARQLMVTGLNSLEDTVGAHFLVFGWANLGRLLRRTRRKQAAEQIERMFLDWLKEHPCSYTPSRIKYEILQDDFIPTSANPDPPVEPILERPEFKTWESHCRETPKGSFRDMLYKGKRIHIEPPKNEYKAGLAQWEYMGYLLGE